MEKNSKRNTVRKFLVYGGVQHCRLINELSSLFALDALIHHAPVGTLLDEDKADPIDIPTGRLGQKKCDGRILKRLRGLSLELTTSSCTSVPIRKMASNSLSFG